jgi:nucleotide-binding universal stress UspA family protein
LGGIFYISYISLAVNGMSDDFNTLRPPGLLLATDLSARCDRALERTRQLAAEFGWPIDVLTVFDAPQAPGDVLAWIEGDGGREREVQGARIEVAREFDGTGLRVNQRFAVGKVDEAILEAAAALPNHVVVTGASHDDSLGRLILGSTVERLARGLAQPLLVVRRRVRGSYRSILVAVDGSGAARLAVQLAARLFPDRRIVAHYAYPAPDAPDAPDRAAAAKAEAKAGAERFLDSCGLAPAVRANVGVLAAEGEPGPLLAHYVRTGAVDLAVFGLHAESALARLLAASRNERLLQDVACDTLLVPA